MANHELKEYTDSLDVLMALSRTKDNQKAQCIRVVAKNYERDLAFLEAKVKLLGGKWRIHKTVNRRDTEKARKWLLKKLIDFPDGRGFVDSLWRTALLQKECIYGDKRFLFDVDTKDYPKLVKFEMVLGESNQAYIERVETENGWHYITPAFDTRKICELDYVELIRDGYIYIKTVREKNENR